MITDFNAKSITPSDKTRMIYDSENLYLMVTPKGGKYWIYRYWENKREHKRSLGSYPKTGIKEARIKRDELQAARRKGIDITNPPAPPATFGEVAREWFRIWATNKATHTHQAAQRRLERYILPLLEKRAITSITSADVLQVCRRVEKIGHHKTAKNIRAIIGQVFRYGIITGAVENDPTIALAGALKSYPTQHYKTFTDPSAIHALIKAMSGYPYLIPRAAMLFSIHTFARPGEIVGATWDEIDMASALWKINGTRTKKRRDHLVPLTRQMTELLTELRELSLDIQAESGTNWLFPSTYKNGNHIPSIRYVLTQIGYTRDIIVPHGFRAMASTILNESELFRPDVIERQLAHVDANLTRATYNRAEYLKERRVMLQWWSDFLEGKPTSA